MVAPSRIAGSPRLRRDLPARPRRRRRSTGSGAINDAGLRRHPLARRARRPGLTVEHNAAWQYECALAGVPPFLNMVGLVLAGGALLQFGTPEQQTEHLRATLRRRPRVVPAVQRAGRRQRPRRRCRPRAERDGDRFVVNGQKVWCSGGRYSNWGILMARTDPDACPSTRASRSSCCPMDLPGVEVRPLKQMTGEAEFDEVFFTDVRLPADHLLGPLHGGWGVGHGRAHERARPHRHAASSGSSGGWSRWRARDRRTQLDAVERATSWRD